MLNELALFAGGGGGILGGVACNFRTVCAVEIEQYPRDILFARQRDGILPRFPIWDDIRTFDGKPWKGYVDVISGGFPCQDISAAAGSKAVGITGARSGLVFEMLRIIEEVRPRFVLAENSPNLRTRGLGTVLSRLAEMGYDARWGVLGAWHSGAPHKRDRMWIVATNSEQLRVNGREEGAQTESEHYGETQYVADSSPIGLQNTEPSNDDKQSVSSVMCGGESSGRQGVDSEGGGGTLRSWPHEPELCRVAYGVTHRVARLKALGNGQVPAVVKMAWNLLREHR